MKVQLPWNWSMPMCLAAFTCSYSDSFLSCIPNGNMGCFSVRYLDSFAQKV